MESCVGNERKLKICSKYFIKPVIHSMILNGQSKNGCCGVLTDEYYAFAFKAKNSKDPDFEYFYVGKSCADSFLKLIKHPGLSLFNPLKSTQAKGTSYGNWKNPSVKKDAPINLELIQAVNLLCISWGTIPKSALADVLDFTRSRIDIPNYRGIEILNRVISKDTQVRTLKEMIIELAQNNELREFSFPLINAYMSNVNEQNNFE
ncbi:MAG: hypothetical protein RLN88_10925 [Ekhidna sp.]|uniref:hypothetical protein n=1 Tax=Ekhidna sp. TaxID=2608089 RepID=UPI0032EF2205